MKHRILWIAMLLSSLFVAFSCDKSDPKKTEKEMEYSGKNYLYGKSFVFSQDEADNSITEGEFGIDKLYIIFTETLSFSGQEGVYQLRLECPYQYKNGIVSFDAKELKVVDKKFTLNGNNVDNLPEDLNIEVLEGKSFVELRVDEKAGLLLTLDGKTVSPLKTKK